MEAILPSDSGHQQPVNLDGDTGITLGSDGQIQVDDNDGDWSHPEGPVINPLDGNQGSDTLIYPVETVLNSQTLPEPVPTISSNIVEPSATSSIDFTPTETQTEASPIPSSVQLPSESMLPQMSSIASPLFASAVTSFVASSSLLTPESATMSTSMPWPSWSTSQSFSYSSMAPTSTILSSNRSISSTIIISSGVSGRLPSSGTESAISQISSAASISTSKTSSLPISSSITTAAQIPTRAVVPPSTPTDFNVHTPTFYAGITVGTIISVGLIAALVAWWVRLRSRRRRNARLMVPWGRPGNMDDGGLEAGIGAFDTDNAARAAMNLGSREDLAHVQAWSPRGDRDVGEPKRAEGYFNGPFYGLTDYHNPRSDYYPFFSNGIPQSTAKHDGVAKRHLPAHLVADEIAARTPPAEFARDERYSRIAYPENTYASEYDRAHQFRSGTVSSPPSHHERNAGRPWDDNPCHSSEPRSMAKRLRNLGKATAEPPGAESGPSPSSEGPRPANAEMEEWGHSLKASLVSAFNAVAANLGTGAPHLKEDDKLTAPPSRRSTRKSIKDAKWERDTSGEKVGRKGSISSASSKPWTLEETAEGAGVVHIRLPGLEDSEPPASRPYMQRQALSFSRGGDCSERLGTIHDAVKSDECQIPPVAFSKHQQSFVRRDTYFSKRDPAKFTPSRSRSIYSTISARSSGFPRDGSKRSRLRCVTDTAEWRTHDAKDEDSVVIRPDTISRLPSADSSIMPTRSSADEFASRALQTRLKRLGSRDRSVE